MVRFSPEARLDLLAARDGYESRAPGVGFEFVRMVDVAVSSIERFPEAFPRVHPPSAVPGSLGSPTLIFRPDCPATRTSSAFATSPPAAEPARLLGPHYDVDFERVATPSGP